MARAVRLRQIAWLRPVTDYVDRLVHVSARADRLTAMRHRAFIGVQLVAGLSAAGIFPAYLALRGGLGFAEVAAFACLTAPILVALYLSRTGRLAAAHLMSSALLSALIAIIASQTGGIASFAIAWALVVPAAAALSGSRRTVAAATMMIALTAAGIGAANLLGLIAPAEGAAASGFAHGAAIFLAIPSVGLLAGLSTLLHAMGAQMVQSGEQRYAILARNITDLVTHHGAGGHVTDASFAAESLLQAAPASLRGQGLFERVHVSDRPIYLSALSRAACDGEMNTAEFRLRCGTGGHARYIWAEMRCRPAGGADGEVIAVIRDISERKAHETALEEAREAAEQANAAKGRFLATMSHELRTPLNAVIGFSEMLMSEATLPLDPERRHEYAELIHDSGHHLLAVVNGILDMSKLESGNFQIVPEPFPVRDLVESCRNMMLLKAQASGIELTTAVAGDVGDIVADKRACRQIYLNLLSNALKFTPAGGRVTVGAESCAGDIVLFVSDTGVGIASSDLPRLGEAFFQASSSYDRTFEGTGLGLSVVKGLAQLHGGRMDVESRVGGGTRVAVRLPLDCEEAMRPKEQPASRITRLPARSRETRHEIMLEQGKKRA
jgi:cell cycle sensor histidine kinase DivJ